MQGGAAVLTGEKTMAQWLAETSAQSQELYNTFMGLDEVQAEVAESSGEAGDGLEGEADALKKAEAAAKKAAEQLEKVSERNKGILSLTEKMGDNQKKYAEDHAEAVQKIADAQIDLNEATDEYGAKSDEAFAAREGLDEARAGLAELEVAWHEATLRMTYDMIVTKLSIDGLTDAEFEAAIQIGITSGIYSQETANMAREMWATTDSIVAGIHAMERLGASAQQAAVQVSSIKYAAAVQGSMKGLTSPKNPGGIYKRDAGGSGMAGTPYMIGTGAQPEMFVPSTNGNFIPNADKKGIGTTYNIVINNPKKETAENSIRQELKKLSYIGVAA